MFKKITSFLFKHYPLFLSICIIFISFHTWINPQGYLTSGDWPFYYKEFLSSAFGGFPQLWISYWGFGGVDYAAAFDILKFLYSSISHIADYNISERVLYFWPIVFVSPITSYVFLSSLIKNKIAVFIGMLVILCNIYILMLSTGDVTLLIAYSFAPLIFYLFSYSLEKRKFIYALLNSLVIGVSFSYEPRATYIILWLLFLYYIFYSICIKRSKFIKNSLLAASNVIPAFILSAYWIFPLIASKSIVSNSLFSRGLFGDQFLNISYAITLYHPFWTGKAPAIFVNQPIPWYFWLIPITAFLGLYLTKKNKKIIFFGLISLLGILLTKQSDNPFQGLYLWLYWHFPGFNAFREASKFYFLIVIGYGVLIASFIDWLWTKYKVKGKVPIAKIIVTGVIATIFLFNLKPLITGEIQNLFSPRAVPNNYMIEKNTIDKQPDYFRTMWIPTYSRWTSFTNMHPAISMATVMGADWTNFTLGDNPLLSQAEIYIQFLHKPTTQQLFSVSSIKYIYLPIGDKMYDDNLYVYYGKDKSYYINNLNNISWLKRITNNVHEIVVYENKDYRPHLYTTNEIETTTKNIPYNQIKYSSISPTEYTLELNNIKSPVYLNFSEAYNIHWNLYIGKFTWFDVFRNPQGFLSNKNHKENNAMLNSFYINPKEICQTHIVRAECVKNGDGTYTIHATLYFIPEAYMYVGFIVTGICLVLIGGYICAITILSTRRKYEKNY